MAAKNVLNNLQLTEIKIFMKRIKDAGISYKKIILFGSYAKGDAKIWSDIDLCIVSDDFGKNRCKERLKLMHIKNDATLDIEPHPYNTKDLANKWDPLAEEIRKYGIPIQV